MTGVDNVTAENKSVEDSLKIAVWGTVVMPNVTYNMHAHCAVGTQFYCSGQTCPSLHLCLLLNLRVKYVFGILRIIAETYVFAA